MKISEKIKKTSLIDLYDQYEDICYHCSENSREAIMIKEELYIRLGNNIAFAALNYLRYSAELQKADDILIKSIDAKSKEQLRLIPDTFNKSEAILEIKRGREKANEDN